MPMKARPSIPYSRGPHTFSANGQIRPVLGFEGHMVSVSTTQSCRSKAATDDTQTNGCGGVLIKPCLWAQIWISQQLSDVMKYLSSFDLFQLFKTVKIKNILNSQERRQQAGFVPWAVVCWSSQTGGASSSTFHNTHAKKTSIQTLGRVLFLEEMHDFYWLSFSLFGFWALGPGTQTNAQSLECLSNFISGFEVFNKRNWAYRSLWELENEHPFFPG